MKLKFKIFLLLTLLMLVNSYFFCFASNDTDEISENKYDSMQWFFKSKYFYEVKNDLYSAYNAILKACDLDFENVEAFAYLKILSEKLNKNLPEKFTPKLKEYNGKSYAANRWFYNGIEAYKRNDLKNALMCFEEALKNDPLSSETNYMLNIIKREIALYRLKEKLEIQFLEKEKKTSQPKFESKVQSSEAKEFLELTSGSETKIQNNNTIENIIEKVSEYDSYLSIKTAKMLLKSGIKTYDPERFTQWLGLARYTFYVLKDYYNAKLAIETALLFYDSNETALKLKEEIDIKIKELEEKENLRKKQEQETIEKIRLQREEEEKKKRTVSVSEVVITNKNQKETQITGDFVDEDFLIETSELNINPEEIAINLSKNKVLNINEIDLTSFNDEKSKNQKIELVREYVTKHMNLAQEKFNNGKIIEALLEYEKIYQKILEIDPNDVKSLYNLVLIYKKLNETKNAQYAFINLVNAINITSAKYSNLKSIQKIYQFVECTIKSAIINAALLAYNKQSKYPMDRSNFSINKLREKKFLFLKDEDEFEISLSLNDNKTKPQNLIKTQKFIIKGYKCPCGGRYYVDSDGSIACSIHGNNVSILSSNEVDKIESSIK